MTKTKRNRGGRPPLHPDEKLGYRLNIYLRNATGDQLEALAKEKRQTVSTLVRGVLAMHLEVRQ